MQVKRTVKALPQANSLPNKLLWCLFGLLAAILAIQIDWGRFIIPPTVESTGNLWLIFLTGLTAGGLSCLAVQGGLLATVVARREQLLLEQEARTRGRLTPILLFLGTKLIVYTLLGGLLGVFGSLLSLTPIARGWLQIVLGVFMLAVALQMFNVHPFFRYFILQPPKRVQRLVRQNAKREDAFAPLSLGALTVFIPCGVTQAIQFVALASGDPVRGALIMFAFTLGTSPLFLLLGILTVRLSTAWQGTFLRFAAGAIAMMALFSILGGTRLLGYTGTLSSTTSQASTTAPLPPPGSAQEWVEQAQLGAVEQVKINTTGVQEVRITVHDTGYTPARVQVRSGTLVRLSLVTQNNYGCARAFTIPALGIQKLLPETGTETIGFIPTQPGRIAFTCSMGMYGGVIEVTE
jgi:uncharacterized protein